MVLGGFKPSYVFGFPSRFIELDFKFKIMNFSSLRFRKVIVSHLILKDRPVVLLMEILGIWNVEKTQKVFQLFCGSFKVVWVDWIDYFSTDMLFSLTALISVHGIFSETMFDFGSRYFLGAHVG